MGSTSAGLAMNKCECVPRLTGRCVHSYSILLGCPCADSPTRWLAKLLASSLFQYVKVVILSLFSGRRMRWFPDGTKVL